MCVKGINVAHWSIKAILDTAQRGHTECPSALIVQEFLRQDVDNAAVIEVCISEEGSLSDKGFRYTFYWSGRLAVKGHFLGMGFIVRNSITFELENLPTGYSDNIMSVQLPQSNQQYATLFNMYSLTL